MKNSFDLEFIDNLKAMKSNLIEKKMTFFNMGQFVYIVIDKCYNIWEFIKYSYDA